MKYAYVDLGDGKVLPLVQKLVDGLLTYVKTDNEPWYLPQEEIDKLVSSGDDAGDFGLYGKQAHDFAVCMLLNLDHTFGGFSETVVDDAGGTGVYSNGFAWRTLAPRDINLYKVNAILKSVLPLFPLVALAVGNNRLVLDWDHEEDGDLSFDCWDRTPNSLCRRVSCEYHIVNGDTDLFH